MSYNRCLQIFNAKYSCSNSTIKVTTKFQQPTSLLAQRELVVKQGLHLGWKFQFGTQRKYFFYCTDSTPITIVSIVSIYQHPSSFLLLSQSCPRMATMLKNANSWLSPRANLSLCCWQNSIWQPANQVHKYILWPKKQQFRIWWFLSVFIDLAVSLFFNVLVQNIYFSCSLDAASKNTQCYLSSADTSTQSSSYVFFSALSLKIKKPKMNA